MARLIRHTARNQKKLLLLNSCAALLRSAAEALLFVVIYQAVSLISGASLPTIAQQANLSRGSTFLILLLAVSVIQLIASGSRALDGVLSGRFAARCQAEILPRIHNHILSLSYGCASGFKAGDLARQASIAPVAINTEIEQASLIVSDGLLALVYLLVLVRISPWLLLLATVLAISTAFTQAWLRPRIGAASREVEHQQRRIGAAITANLQVLRLLHSSAGTAAAKRSFQQDLQGLELRLRRLSTLRSLMEPIAELLPTLIAVVLALLSWQLTSGRSELLIPGLATFVLALQRLNIRLVKVGQSANQLAENLPRIELLNDLLAPEGKTFRRRGGLPFAALRQEICFEGVTLLYPGRSQASLIDVSFQLPRNGTVALVGASGAGKSSLVDLLVGLIDPSAGRILVDGQDLQRLDLDSWQRRLGVVSQEVLVVHDTIAANIAFGLGDDVSQDAIRRAATAACANDFIEALPEGYNTVIGEQGHRLSGGQRQRLSLARAMLREPEILILDEATSALDSHAEARVHQAIDAFRSGRTVLAVAHRLSSIRDADQILVVAGGRVAERGTHDQLLAQGGAYAGLWRRQQGRPHTPTTSDSSP
ncbi:MAG: ABC transporter ATP-binding protein [Cyanobacteriota bacterium]|nr:ABC transporter ATP-binding protein [Cyanobacteriota bacterium]